MRSILTIVLLGLTVMVSAQSAGSLKGKLVDANTKEPLMMATVRVFQGGILIKGTTTDFDGYYKITPINPGTYEVKFEYVGYNVKEVQGVMISPDQTTTLNGLMSESVIGLEAVEIVHYKVPLMDKGSHAKVTSSDDIDQIGATNMNNVVSLSAGMYQKDDGAALNAKGSRDGGNVYYVDGVKMIGSSSVPVGAIDQISVVNGGVPARYGDAIGAIINITTKGVSSRHFAAFEGRTSKGLDPYGFYFGQGTYGGPLLWKSKAITKQNGEAIKAKDGTDSVGRVPFLGLLLSGSGQYQKDQSPSATGVWTATDSMLNLIEQNPVGINPGGVGYIRNSETMSGTDFHNVKVRPNNSRADINLTSKLTFAVSDQIDLSFGSRGMYRKEDLYSRNNSLLNANNNGAREITEYSMYGKFAQRLSKDKVPDENGKLELDFISNAFYSLQLDYSTYQRNQYSDQHKFNAFDYGHYGNFDYKRKKVDFNDLELVSNAAVFNGDTGLVFTSWQEDGLVSFTPSTKNPLLANYTQNYLDLRGSMPDGINDVQIESGYINGISPATTHSLYNSSGGPYNFLYKQNRQQIRLTLAGNVDLNFKGSGLKKDSVYTHSLQFGFEYEERELSVYYINNPIGMWGMMNQYLNAHITPDNTNPIPVGNSFGSYTNYYLPDVANADEQSTFDLNLRNQLNAGETDFINVHNLNPDELSLDLFSAHEMTNASASSTYAQYYGYDYKGNKLASNSNIGFADFFTDKENRPIAALQPRYAAFYVEDKFEVNDLAVRFGLRVDQFDANTMVLKDKFSLYETYSAGMDDSQGGNILATTNHPGNIGADYVVYVDDINAPSKVVGYRNNDDWYNAEGVQIANGKQVALQSASGDIQPYLVRAEDDIKAEGYDPNTSFTDYIPQFSIMPRINFGFALNADALFFAHYDVLTQRPGGLSTFNVATPFDYMYMQEIVATQNLGNPDLKPEKTIDYSIGFQQKISQTSVIKISTFYREMRNMIHLRKINFAYPVSYKTFDNTDFSTIKGFTFAYDLRRTGNIKLTADYTLQFVEGTGSNAYSNENFIDAISNLAEEDPDMKIIHPLSYDQRHTLTTNVDYRFGSGTDYKGPRFRRIVTNESSIEDTTFRNILENFGVNAIFRLGSGTPYSKQAEVTEAASMNSSRSTSEGSINGSRMPGSFKVDLKIDKSFDLKFGKKPENDTDMDMRKKMQINIYLQVKNVLNAKNIIGVYSYTGNPDDDGFLASKLGAQVLEGKTTEEQKVSYTDMYMAKLANPAFYIKPRRAFIGVKLNF